MLSSSAVGKRSERERGGSRRPPATIEAPALVRFCRRAVEAVSIGMACLAPWAYGATEAWAGLLLAGGVAALAVLGAVAGWGSDRSRLLCNMPSLALAALALLGLAHSLPLTPGILRVLSPSTAALRASLIPASPERVSGDDLPPVPLPAATLSLSPEAAFVTAARLASAWVLFQSVLTLGSGFASLRRFTVAIVANCTLLALYSLVQALSWNGKIYWFHDSPTGSAGPFYAHNHLAAYLNMGLGLSLGCLMAPGRDDGYGERRGGRLWAAYSAGVIVAGVVGSLSRSGFLSATVTLVAAIILLRPRKVHLLAGLGAAALLVPLFLYALGGASPYQQRLTTLLESTPYADRLHIWRDAIRAVPFHPLIGSGLGNFSLATLRFYRRDTLDQFDHAENEYVEWLVEGGVVGFGLVLIALVGVFRLGRKGQNRATSPEERTLVWGAFLAVLTLLIQSLADFAMHIPGVVVTAVVLCAHLARLGLATRDPSPRLTGRALLFRSALPGLGVGVLGIALLYPWHRLARSEAALDYAGISMTGDAPVLRRDGPDPELVASKLEESLLSRPEWGEGYLRLGELYWGLYVRNAQEAIRATVPDPSIRARLDRTITDPIWLHQRIHTGSGDHPLTVEELLTYPHVRFFLVPAARCYLRARQCSPLLALPQARLAALNYLLRDGDQAGAYLRRALLLAGADTERLKIVTQTAKQIGDLDLAAQCWRKALIVSPTPWEQVADDARDLLTPDQILRKVVPDGRRALWFANRLYSAPADKAARRQFLEAAIERLPGDADLSQADRAKFEAETWDGLDDRPRAVLGMKAALALEPTRADWRKQLIEWLVERRHFREARDEVALAIHYTPNHPDTKLARELLARAEARADPEPSLVPD